MGNETSESGSLSSNARAGVYTTAGVTTTACTVADVLGALGICSAINLAVTATSAITLEVALAEMRANLEILHNDGNRVIKDVQELMVNQDSVEDYLDEEEEVLVFWVRALETVERKIQNPDRLFFQTLPVLRERYLASLDNLGKAAQEYLDQQEL